MTESKWVLDHLGAIYFHIVYMPHIVYEPEPNQNDSLIEMMPSDTDTQVCDPTLSNVNKRVGDPTPIPERLRQSPYVLNVVPSPTNAASADINNDKLCLLRVVAYGLCLKENLDSGSNLPPTPKQYNEKTKHIFKELYGDTKDMNKYKGTQIKEIADIENITATAISLYKFYDLKDLDSPLLIDRKANVPGLHINILLVDDHALYIKSVKDLAHCWLCQTCYDVFSSKRNLTNHMKTCTGKARENFVGGVYKTPKTMNEELEAVGLSMSKPFYESFIVYDFEAVLMPDEQWMGRTHIVSRHIPVSVSIASTVEGYKEPHFILDKENPQRLIDDFLKYINAISEVNFQNFLDENADLLVEFKEKIKEEERKYEEEHKFIKENNLKHHCYKKNAKELTDLYDKLMLYGQQIPVIGFNSGKYDINLIKQYLFNNMVVNCPNNPPHVIKRNNSFMSIVSPHQNYKMLDICNYLAPGTSYASFLKCFNTSQAKGMFPFTWFTDVNKLDETELPPKEMFYNTLKEQAISDEDYNYLSAIFKDNNMTCMADFLKWYNNLDVGPFVEAMQNMISLFKTHGLDLLKQAVSISKLSFIYMMKSIPDSIKSQSYFYCAHKSYRALHDDFRANMLGGASIIFKRRAEVGEDIHTLPKGVETAKCKTITGFDCNSLYPWAKTQEMPCGHPIVRLKCENFKPTHAGSFELKPLQWFMYLNRKHGVHIEHKFNGPERRLGARRIPVDGFVKTPAGEADIVYQFHGCYWHGCTAMHHGWLDSEKRGKGPKAKTWEKIRADTKEVNDYLTNVLNLKVITMWECHWDEWIEYDSDARDIVNDPFFTYQSIPTKHPKGRITDEDICAAICRNNNPLFGFIMCDVSTPDHLKALYDQFPMVYRHYGVSRKDLEPWLQNYANENGLLKKPSKLLITCHEATDILLATQMVKFYISKGLKITNISKIYQYRPMKCFEEFVKTCQEKRIAGDLDPSKALFANLFKSFANHAYGYTLTRKDRHKDTLYVNKSMMKQHCRKRTFLSASDVGQTGELFEVLCNKETVNIDLPVQIGVMVYNISKLKMLQFVYDCILRFCKQSHIAFLSTDTDSLYLSLGANDLHGCLKPELKKIFYKEYEQWFPPPFCSAHKSAFIEAKLADQHWDQNACEACKLAYIRGNRQVGLFKMEYSGGHWFVGLCSKTYAVGVDDTEKGCKAQAKGVSKNISQLRKKNYLAVLETQKSGEGKNKGMFPKNNQMFTYEQTKLGLSFFYCKRKLLEDGIHTTTLTCQEADPLQETGPPSKLQVIASNIKFDRHCQQLLESKIPHFKNFKT